MEHNSTYNIRHASLGIESELQRLQAQALMGWDRELRNLKRFGLQDGMKLLEAGCGPGFVTQKLVEAFPGSELTALDVDRTLLDKAESLLSHTPIPGATVDFVHASVLHTGQPDNSFDFAVARLIFLHLHNPLEAAMELLRVLKPGGKLVIIDIDDGIFGAVHPDMSCLHTVLDKLARHQASKGGNRYIGRELPRLLTAAGYGDVDMEAVVLHSDLVGIDGFRRQFHVDRFTGLYKSGVITEEEYEQLKLTSERLGSSPDAYAMMLFFMACGTKV